MFHVLAIGSLLLGAKRVLNTIPSHGGSGWYTLWRKGMELAFTVGVANPEDNVECRIFELCIGGYVWHRL